MHVDGHRISFNKINITAGYLHKKSTGAVKRWQRRWFSVQNQNLVYYQSKNAKDHAKDKEINLLTEVIELSLAYTESVCFYPMLEIIL